MPSDLDAPFIPADLRPAPSVIMTSMISILQRRAITGHLFDHVPLPNESRASRRPQPGADAVSPKYPGPANGNIW